MKMNVATASKILSRVLSLTILSSLSTVTAYAVDENLDKSFGSGGKVTTNFASGDVIHGIAIQSDGKIVVAGETDVNGVGNFALARYNSDGSLDKSFGGGDGKVTSLIGAGSGANAVAIQSDGKIVAAGVGRSAGHFDFDFVVARYNKDGSPDSGFNGTGSVITPIGSGEIDDIANAVAIQKDGKIIVAGSTSPSSGGMISFALARYNTNGSLDSTFNGTGIATTAFVTDREARAVVIQSDGKIIAAGRDPSSGTALGGIARYNTNGTMDNAFGPNGNGRTFINGVGAFAAALQSDGKIVLAGFGMPGSSAVFAVARLKPDASLDPSFDADGRAFTDFDGEADQASAVAIQSDGKIIAAGQAGFASKFALARYNVDGSLDTSFGSSGKATTAFANSSAAFAVASQSDGKLVAAGRSGINSTADFALARYAGGASPSSSQLLNLSTRKQVGTGANVLIGGFIVVGSENKKVLLRGLGPSLPVSGPLADPTLELHAGDTTLLGSNDNWRQATNANEIAAVLPPSNDLESAILTSLAAKPASAGGAGYTGVLAGKGGATGIGLLEIYDLDTAANSKLANISTRGFVGTGDDLLIGGFIPGPADRLPLKVLVRALGPSLTAQGVDGALSDPLLELHDANG